MKKITTFIEKNHKHLIKVFVTSMVFILSIRVFIYLLQFIELIIYLNFFEIIVLVCFIVPFVIGMIVCMYYFIDSILKISENISKKHNKKQ